MVDSDSIPKTVPQHPAAKLEAADKALLGDANGALLEGANGALLEAGNEAVLQVGEEDADGHRASPTSEQFSKSGEDLQNKDRTVSPESSGVAKVSWDREAGSGNCMGAAPLACDKQDSNVRLHHVFTSCLALLCT